MVAVEMGQDQEHLRRYEDHLLGQVGRIPQGNHLSALVHDRKSVHRTQLGIVHRSSQSSR